MPKKLNTNTFIEKARTVHGDKYDYSSTVYVNATTDVTIICPIHGAFSQRACNHINARSGCPKCVQNFKKTEVDFISDAREVHGDKYDYSRITYIDVCTPVDILCPLHGLFQQPYKMHVTLRTGCPRCKQQRISDTVQKRYGVNTVMKIPEVIEARKANSYQKYGTEYPSSSHLVQTSIRNALQEKYGVTSVRHISGVQQKIEQTCLDRYGVVHPWANTDVRVQIAATLKEKYGASNASRSVECSQRKIHTVKEKYGVDYFSQSHIDPASLIKLENKEWMYEQHVSQQVPLLEISKLLDVSDTTVGRYMRLHGIDTQTPKGSYGERTLRDWIRGLELDVVCNDRSIIKPKEIDIYIPSKQLAIEYCGLYWHSDTFKSRQYHKNKLDICITKGIRLITIFEDEWINQRELVQKKLTNILGLSNSKYFARQCVVKEVSKAEKTTFLNQYHIQGDGPSSLNLGLYKENELVSVATFMFTRKETTLTRFCSSVSITGGFSKLLAYFKANYAWDILSSFADLRWSEGHLYQHTGWEHVYTIPPDYYWCHGNNRYHKFQFRHKYLKTKLKSYDPSLSESENCYKNGLIKIYDCGKMKFILRNNK